MRRVSCVFILYCCSPSDNCRFTLATSVDVERAFSKGSLTVSKHRHSLSDKSTRAAIVLSSWLQVGGIVVDKDIIEVFEEKARRPKGTGASQGDSIEIE